MTKSGISEYQLRDFIPNDKEDILELFELSFGRNLQPEAWEWRYLQGLEVPIVKLLYDGDVLIGHNAVNVLPLRINQKQRSIALAMTIMTHPQYQGKGIFPELAEETYSAAKERGIMGVFGFPNRIIEKSYFKYLDWTRSQDLREYSLALNTSFCSSDQVGINDPEFGNEFDDFWESICNRFSVVVPRTKRLLNWRLTGCPPEYVSGHYKVFSVTQNRRLAGYLVFKLYTRNKPPSAHILDILTGDNAVAEMLLQAACNYAIQNGAPVINSWIYTEHPQRRLFEKYGFKASDDTVVLGGRFFMDTGFENSLDVFRNWHVSMLDSDVF